MVGTTNALKMAYTVDDAPPIYLCALLGIQQFLTMVGGTIASPLMVGSATCIGEDLVGRAQLLGTLMVVVGIATLLQTLIGVRLPIIQGASFTFIAPIFAMQNMEEFKCPDFTSKNFTDRNFTIGNDEHRAIWMSRLVEIQGALLVAAAFEALLGAFGIVAIILRAVGPLTIAPTIGLVGLSFADDIITHHAAKHWPTAILSLGCVVAFTLYLTDVEIPLPKPELEERKRLKIKIVWFRLFGLFPVLLSIILVWALCAILTATDVFSNNPTHYGYQARVDIHIHDFMAADWIRFPYPGQWGCPRVSIALVLGMTAAIIATMIETIGDFYACARLCGAPPPPHHAISRGIFMEGIGCAIAGAFGCGPGVTSYAENVGAIAITRVASRRVFYVTAVLLIVFGCVTKIAAVFALIPVPVIGGVLMGMLSMVSAVGFSSLQFIDLNSTRNLLIFGLSMFLGIAMPMWIKHNRKEIDTGSEVFDQILVVLLSTGMLVGGLIGFCLDNTVPGATREQRGMGALASSETSNNDTSSETVIDTYDFPLVGKWLKKWRILRFIPILPTFDPSVYSRSRKVENFEPKNPSQIEIVDHEVTSF